MTLNLCGKFINDDFECYIALRKREGQLLSLLDPNINVIELAPNNILQFIPSLIKEIRKIKPCTVITAFSDIGILTWVAIKLSGVKVQLIHGVHDTHRAYKFKKGFLSSSKFVLNNFLAGIIYRLADELVVVSKGLGDELRNRFKIKISKIHLIYNPIIPDNFIPIVRQPSPCPFARDHIEIVALGRLSYQKGFDLLIKSMALVSRKNKWNLTIYGDGPEYSNLSTLITELGLDKSIQLKGFISNPFEKLASSDIFIMPSRHEGFGNVLVEALACGLPVIASDCLYGPREILEDGKHGTLVQPENIDMLAAAISDFMISNKNSYNSGIERAKQFTVESSFLGWKKLVCTE